MALTYSLILIIIGHVLLVSEPWTGRCGRGRGPLGQSVASRAATPHGKGCDMADSECGVVWTIQVQYEFYEAQLHSTAAFAGGNVRIYPSISPAYCMYERDRGI